MFSSFHKWLNNPHTLGWNNPCCNSFIMTTFSLKLLCRIHISILRTPTHCHFRVPLFPFLSACLSSNWCFVSSHYSNVFINIYVVFRDREEEDCEGGQQSLSTPTSLVMELIQCNKWIAIFWAANERQLREREGCSESFNLLFANIFQPRCTPECIPVS